MKHLAPVTHPPEAAQQFDLLSLISVSRLVVSGKLGFLEALDGFLDTAQTAAADKSDAD